MVYNYHAKRRSRRKSTMARRPLKRGYCLMAMFIGHGVANAA